MSLAPCDCEPSATNAHSRVKRLDGTPAHCTSSDLCEACGGAGCDACQMRGYSQHCERRMVDGVERPGWQIRALGVSVP